MSYKDFPVRLVDVSRFQDNPDTVYKPTFDKLKAEGFQGTGVRVGFGLVEDPLFRWYWQQAKGVLERLPYWYLDYYSHRGTSTTDEEWGAIQANECYDLLKGDFGEGPLALDCEDSSYGGRVSILTASSYNKVARAFANEWLRLTGKPAMIYCSPGFLWVFGSWAKPLSMWMAWYSRQRTLTEMQAKLSAVSWTGGLKLWQYASDGDVDDDGDADGITLGMESAALDLNVFIGTAEEWSRFCGNNTPVDPEEEPEEPVGVIIPVEMTVLPSGGLNVRDVPIGVSGSQVVGWLARGSKVLVSEMQKIGANVWARTGTFTWCAIEYNGIKYMA